LKNIGGVWLPDGEEHLVQWMRARNELVDGRLTYQHHKLQAALAYVRAWRSAVDVGAHVGLWATHLVKRFEVVHAFEPIAEHRACFERNVGPGALLYPAALGARTGTVRLRQNGESTGDTCVVPDDAAPGAAAGEAAPLERLDDYDLLHVDFLKIDCEGYEAEVLKGAEETLARCRPVICVEQKPARLARNFGLRTQPALDWLRARGAVVREEISGDFILTWD